MNIKVKNHWRNQKNPQSRILWFSHCLQVLNCTGIGLPSLRRETANAALCPPHLKDTNEGVILLTLPLKAPISLRNVWELRPTTALQCRNIWAVKNSSWKIVLQPLVLMCRGSPECTSQGSRKLLLPTACFPCGNLITSESRSIAWVGLAQIRPLDTAAPGKNCCTKQPEVILLGASAKHSRALASLWCRDWWAEHGFSQIQSAGNLLTASFSQALPSSSIWQVQTNR